MFKEYFKTIDFLESLSNLSSGRPLGQKQADATYLKRIGLFLNMLGDPHLGMEYIHIGGTSGKGSVATMAHSIISEAGFKCGTYRSPHVSCFTERIKAGDLLISPQDVVRLAGKIKPVLEKYLLSSPYGPLSYLEIVFALSLLYFKEQKCRYVALEVSCGGKNDMTNIIPPAKVTMITNIGHDHLDSFGPRLSDVAREKAGIIKKGTYFLTTEKNRRHLRIFQENGGKAAHYNFLDPGYKIIKNNLSGVSFEYNGEDYSTPLPGEHQIFNAVLAIEMGKLLGISSEHIKKGLKKTRIPGRLELMASAKAKIILDAAHNEEKAGSLADFISTLEYKKLRLVMSVKKDKDLKKIFERLIPLADELLITRSSDPFIKSADPKILMQAAKKIKPGLKIGFFLKSDEALETALERSGKGDLIVATGSIYMIGQLREKWISQEYILRTRKEFK